jgi:putative flippase GtrA
MLSETNGQLVRYLTIGALNTAIGLGIILIFTLFAKFPYWISNAAGYAAGLGFSYFSSRIWTFNVFREKGQAIRYLISFFICYLLQLILLFVLISFIRVIEIYAQVLSMAAYTVPNFTLQKFYVFTGPLLSHYRR